MNRQEFEKRLEKIAEVDKALADIDPSIRAAAYATLEGYITGQAGSSRTPRREDYARRQENLDDAEFILKHHKKDDSPADNVLLLAAWFYREHGTATFTAKEIQTLADGAGLTVPERIDKTLRAAQYEGKKSFTAVGRGAFKPTVHGEKRLREAYNIAKGNKPRQQ
jgi:hypothetical protein